MGPFLEQNSTQVSLRRNMEANTGLPTTLAKLGDLGSGSSLLGEGGMDLGGLIYSS